MENAHDYKNFIDNNRAALEMLGKRIQEIDTVRGVSTVKEFQARQLAIKIIENWMSDLWGISNSEEIYPDEDDPITRVLKGNSQEF